MTRTSTQPAPCPTRPLLSEAFADRSGIMDRYDVGFGLTGISLYFLYRFRAFGHDADLELARETCLRSVHGICEDNPTASRTIECCELGGFLARNADALGLTGVADQLLPTLDTLLERQMRRQLDRGDSDPYTGGFHPAWYFLTARGETTRFSDSWVSALPTAAALAERGPDGHPRIPTGISHGLAGYAVFLDRWLLSLALHPRAAALRQRLKKIGRDYLKVFEDRCDDAFTHGCFYRDGRSETTSRLSLAYGDAGILAAGWQLALTLREGAVAERFLARLRRTAGRRTQRETGITGGSLLYGSAGVLLFFGHLQQRAPCPEFAEATRYWKARARAQVPSFRREDLPVSGPYDYPAMKRLSLFEGAIGPPLAEWALRTDITDLSNLFYLP